MSGRNPDTSATYRKDHNAVVIVLLLRVRGTDRGCKLILHANSYLIVLIEVCIDSCLNSSLYFFGVVWFIL